jgi:hypothetical protein
MEIHGDKRKPREADFNGSQNETWLVFGTKQTRFTPISGSSTADPRVNGKTAITSYPIEMDINTKRAKKIFPRTSTE